MINQRSLCLIFTKYKNLLYYRCKSQHYIYIV